MMSVAFSGQPQKILPPKWSKVPSGGNCCHTFQLISILKCDGIMQSPTVYRNICQKLCEFMGTTHLVISPGCNPPPDWDRIQLASILNRYVPAVFIVRKPIKVSIFRHTCNSNDNIATSFSSYRQQSSQMHIVEN